MTHQLVLYNMAAAVLRGCKHVSKLVRRGLLFFFSFFKIIIPCSNDIATGNPHHVSIIIHGGARGVQEVVTVSDNVWLVTDRAKSAEKVSSIGMERVLVLVMVKRVTMIIITMLGHQLSKGMLACHAGGPGLFPGRCTTPIMKYEIVNLN